MFQKKIRIAGGPGRAGDMVLTTIGRLLHSRFRGSDVPCRLGGGEFATLLADAALEWAKKRTETFRQAVGTLILRYGGQGIGMVILSLGCAAWPLHGENTADLLRSADAAPARATQGGAIG